MDELTKYEGEVIGPGMIPVGPVPEMADTSPVDVLVSLMLRRWRIAVITFGVICVLGLSVIWLLLSPAYEVTGAIRVAPILSNILTGEADKGDVSNFQSFVNTQAEIIASMRVIQRVADDLSDRGLSFFNTAKSKFVAKFEEGLGASGARYDRAAMLKEAINKEVITVAPARMTELIKITMTSDKPEEARHIVDAFIRAYMAVEGLRSTQDEDQTLSVLESERRAFAEKVQSQREAIQQLAKEYGTVTLDGRQNMMLERVAGLLSDLTKVEAQRINLETRIQALEQGTEKGLPQEWLRKRSEYINNDPGMQELLRNVIRLEQDLISAKQLMTPENPMLKQKEEFLESFKIRLDERRQEVSKDFDALAAEEMDMAAKNELLTVRSQLDETIALESRFREKLEAEDERTIELGRKQLAIQDMQYQLALDEQMYDTVMRRIQSLEMERKRPARVSVAYNADVTNVRDKRFKYTAALLFASLAAGMGLAFIKDKMDPSLQSPDDIARRVGIRIIGTTTSPRTIKKALLPKQLTEDYQTIRANLGLLDGGGMPKKVVITSPGMQDGKTTFSINLATSLSRAGQKVLLIDADLRKPDIGRLLNVPREMRCLQEVLMGGACDDSTLAIVSPGLSVLAADSRNEMDPYELLVAPNTARVIDSLAESYDHVIIDTPPVLAFPDALILAKLTGVVILTSFAGRTSSRDFRECKDRLTQIDVKILGTVMSNVDLGHTYYRYGYNYYAQQDRGKTDGGKGGRSSLLLPSEKPRKDSDQTGS